MKDFMEGLAIGVVVIILTALIGVSIAYLFNPSALSRERSVASVVFDGDKCYKAKLDRAIGSKCYDSYKEAKEQADYWKDSWIEREKEKTWVEVTE